MIVVVGGGISGLSTAYHLAQAGHSCTLIERQPRLGGVIQTSQWEGCILEGGPDSFLAAKPEALQLIREVGLESEVISSNDERRVTYVWKGGRLIPLPEGLMMMVPTRIKPVALSPLLSWSTKIRMGLDYLRPPAGPRPERSVAAFIREHYGQETVDYLAEPLLAGVYGGDPEAMSVNSVLPRFVELETRYGSLTRGVLESRKKAPPQGESALFKTLRGGLGQLVEAVKGAIGDRMRHVHGEVEHLTRSETGWRVRVNGETLEAEHVVLATPAWASAGLLEPVDPELARLLDAIDYTSSLTATLVYREGRLDPQKGFGFLVPGKERRNLMACTWVHNKFSHRAPEGYSIWRCFVGGTAADAMFSRSDTEIVYAVLDDLRRMTGLAMTPDFQRVVRWQRSMAQYTLGHAYRLRQIEQRVAALPNLYLAGNAFSGIGVPDCIRTGKIAAQRISATCSQR